MGLITGVELARLPNATVLRSELNLFRCDYCPLAEKVSLGILDRIHVDLTHVPGCSRVNSDHGAELSPRALPDGAVMQRERVLNMEEKHY